MDIGTNAFDDSPYWITQFPPLGNIDVFPMINFGQDQFLRDPLYLKIRKHKDLFATHGMAMPFFIPHEGVNKNTITIDGQELINFASYNYLALSGNPVISYHAKEAIDRYGTSVSASRAISGEIPLHRELEQKIADFVGAEDCLLYVSGHATNVTTIGNLFGPKDLILHDAQIHNSALEGCRLSGAKSKSFKHNNLQHLENQLAKHRNRYDRVLIIIEGIYSMEGDIADLPKFIELKNRYDALLMVDEAHSIGVLGTHGRGIGEHFNTNSKDVDLWMGTLSKSLASCGGYIAGSRELIECLKHTSPGFVYSVGIPPANAAAALAALNLIEQHPEYIQALQDRSKLFLELAKDAGLNTGLSNGTPIIPVITGDSLLAVQMAHALFEKGINVAPIFYPAVKHKHARLRFFIAANHTDEQIRYAVENTAEEFFRRKPRLEDEEKTAMLEISSM